MQGRHDLTDAEWAIISPLPPDKPRGDQRVDDRRAISGIFHILRTGTPWRGLPRRFALTSGQASDKAAVPALLDGLEPARDTVADRGYDARTILKLIADHGSCPTSRPNGTAGSSAWCPITCTANATSSDASSTSSNTSEASRPAITSSQETSSPQSPLPASASGSKSMSPRPSAAPFGSGRPMAKVAVSSFRCNGP